MREPADANLDGLKRKARRRLVGAVVLALAAAVFVPMLLESDQRPLGDDVSVRIPPVEQGKFVNRLNTPAPAAGKSSGAGDAPAKTGEPRSDAGSGKPAAATANNTPEAAPVAQASAADVGDVPAKSTDNAAEAVVATSAPAAAAPAKAVAPAKAEPAPPVEAKPAAAAPKATATAATAKAPHGGFVVQLAAFSDDKGANALANRLKKTGHPAFTEPVSTSRGTLWRVRVGPYASREDANAARDKLKREGQSGIVAARTS
jgi:DedD protein